MHSKLVLANISRTIARIGSIFVILLGLPFVLSAGLQLFSREIANATIFLYLLFLVGMLAGLVIAWWKEGLGAAIALIAVILSFLLGGALLPGVGSGQRSSIFAGPINLLFALLLPGYHPEVSPSAKLVPMISWTLQVIPSMLFIVSWWFRRNSPISKPIQQIPANR